MKEEKKRKTPNFLEKPLYPGGAKALREFVSSHLQYPQDAMEQRIEGVVTVAYQVNDDGLVENPTVVKSLCPSCDEEALRLVRMLRYDKARNRGIRLKVNTKLNINFHLAPKPAQRTISYTLQPSVKKKKEETSSKASQQYGYTITVRKN
ncbi:MAG: energy transducer TonB [Bacteroidales bacterium]|nr:energy transducer TonB [Bacteroidales bacterium]